MIVAPAVPHGDGQKGCRELWTQISATNLGRLQVAVPAVVGVQAKTPAAMPNACSDTDRSVVKTVNPAEIALCEWTQNAESISIEQPCQDWKPSRLT
jgi:hypothetical protein